MNCDGTHPAQIILTKEKKNGKKGTHFDVSRLQIREMRKKWREEKKREVKSGEKDDLNKRETKEKKIILNGGYGGQRPPIFGV